MKRLLAAFLLMFTMSVGAQTLVNLESPVHAGQYSGIGLIGGWAISDVLVDRVEFWVNGTYKDDIPYGGTRGDVERVFPNYPDSLHSGFGMKWSYGLFDAGENTVTIKVYDMNGGLTTRSSTFTTSGFDGFVKDSEIEREIEILGVLVQGESVDITLQWKQASQQYEIIEVFYPDDTPDNVTYTDTYQTRILKAVNDLRSTPTLCGTETFPATHSVTWNNNISNAAMTHSIDMAANDFFDHTGSDGSRFWDRLITAGYTGNATGETIGWNSSTPESTITMWANSPPHCSILMGSHTNEIGHGMAVSSTGRYWTLVTGEK